MAPDPNDAGTATIRETEGEEHIFTQARPHASLWKIITDQFKSAIIFRRDED